jgi:single-strand DNA-binding protein
MNILVIAGRLGRDPEEKTLADGTQLWNFSVAVNGYRNKEKTTDWVRVTAFGSRWEKIIQYIRKGSIVSVAGAVSARAWEKDGGGIGVSLEMIADKISLLQSGPNDGQPVEHNRSQQLPADSQDVPF